MCTFVASIRNQFSIMSIKTKLQGLSFRTGTIVLLMCIPFYIISFAQMLLPLSTSAKGVLWAVFFGIAKLFQYSGITILGVEGYKRLKRRLRRKNVKGGRIKLVIFDFDGTLGDSQKLITDTMLATVDELGLPSPTREQFASTIGLPLRECFTSIMTLTDEEADKCEETYRRIFDEKNVKGAVSLFPGVKETLRRLHEKGFLMSIASSRCHRTLSSLVDDLGLSPYIQYVIGSDDVQHHKPDAESVLVTMEHFDVRPEATVVVGDTEFDILMGCHAGVHTIGVSYGNGSRESLERAGAERVISDIKQLERYLMANNLLPVVALNSTGN